MREARIGLSWARARGIAESDGDILVFIDDDNVLDGDYLKIATMIGRERRQLGCWGGSITPEFSEPPSNKIKPFLKMLAIREIPVVRVTKSPWESDAEPWGAGLCVRRQVATNYCELLSRDTTILTDRAANSLISGGDTELCMLSCSMNLQMGVFPQLKLSTSFRQID